MNNIMAGIIGLFLSLPLATSPAWKPEVLGEAAYSLTNRYQVESVNQVFADNILLTLAYMRGAVTKGKPVDWQIVRADFEYALVLKPNETFAFHDRLLPKYQDQKVISTNAHFNGAEGFKSDGYLMGDGVCHLASFINVVAREAKLTVESPTPHDFAKIPDVEKDLAVSIYYDPNGEKFTEQQNLYITNNRSQPVAFVFAYKNKNLSIKVEEIVVN